MKTKHSNIKCSNKLYNESTYQIMARRDSESSGSLKEAIKLVLKLIGTKIKIAMTKGDIVALKALKHLKELALKALREKERVGMLIKAISNYSKLTVQAWLKQFYMFILQVMIHSYEKEKSAMKLASKDSAELLRLYKDCLTTVNSIKKIQKFLVSKKLRDSRGRISTTTTPTVWEVRQVLGVKPGMSYNEKDWKAYKENGMVIVQNRHKTELRYSKPVNELISIANRERAALENKKDPYVENSPEGYSYETINPKEKSKIERALRVVNSALKAFLAVLGTIGLIKSATKGWGAELRDLIATVLLSKQKVEQSMNRIKNLKTAKAV